MLTLLKFDVLDDGRSVGEIGNFDQAKFEVERVRNELLALKRQIADHFVRLNKPGVLDISQANINTAHNNDALTLPTGAWTPGVAFGGATTGITYTARTGAYTLADDRVIGSGRLTLSSKGSATGTATITGLPFTIYNGFDGYAPVMLRLDKVTFANQYQGYCAINTTTIELGEITEAGAVTVLTDANFANDSDIMVSFCYRRA